MRRQLTTFEKRLAIIGPALVALLLGGALLASLARARASRELVAHTYEVIEALDRTLVRLVDAETGERGFLITADERYLDPYRHAEADVRAGLVRLRSLTADLPAQQRRLDTLEALTTRRMVLLDSTIALRRERGLGGASGVLVAGRGRAVMDSARRVLSAMQEDERALLAARSVSEDRRDRVVVALVAGGSVMAAILALLANRLLGRYAAAQARSARELDEKNALLRAHRAQLEQQVAEMQRLSAERERLLTDLDAANRAKMQFLAAMSHELRTPLNAIDGYAELIGMGIRGPVTKEQTTDLERIRRSGRYLLSLINDILNFAKLEAGRVELHVTDVRLDDTLDEIEPLVAPQIATKGVRYRYVPCDPALTVRADREKLQQVVLNLVTNAIKFTDAGGAITLACDVEEAEVRIRVSDTGRGIPAEKLQAIFDPFVQVRTLTSGGTRQGVGLGLAISRDLVVQMGGALTVASAVGQGSTFEITLPHGTIDAPARARTGAYGPEPLSYDVTTP